MNKQCALNAKVMSPSLERHLEQRLSICSVEKWVVNDSESARQVVDG